MTEHEVSNVIRKENSYEISEQDLMSLERLYKDAKSMKYQSTFASRVYAALFPILDKHVELDE